MYYAFDHADLNFPVTRPLNLDSSRAPEYKPFVLPQGLPFHSFNGPNQSFQVPKGQKFTVNGQQTDVFGLKKGMNVSATAYTEVPDLAHWFKCCLR